MWSWFMELDPLFSIGQSGAEGNGKRPEVGMCIPRWFAWRP